jgi:hypothetical protein
VACSTAHQIAPETRRLEKNTAVKDDGAVPVRPKSRKTSQIAPFFAAQQEPINSKIKTENNQRFRQQNQEQFPDSNLSIHLSLP